MQRAVLRLESALAGLGLAGEMPELIAAELRDASQALHVMVGQIDAESLLDEIFASFCIGK